MLREIQGGARSLVVHGLYVIDSIALALMAKEQTLCPVACDCSLTSLDFTVGSWHDASMR